MKFFAHGKLLLTAEYAVLGGATALAVPTKLGQYLEIEKTDLAAINWKSIDEQGEVWYENTFDTTSFTPAVTDNVGQRLQQLFIEISKQNASVWKNSKGFSFVATLDFNRDWGLGSSSTLISLLAQWANVNPFTLQQEVFGGSGYDVACATAKGPILYKRANSTDPVVTKIDFLPSFKEHLFFVHLNQKQDSQKAVSNFDQNRLTAAKLEEINTLTDLFYKVDTIKDFQELIHKHETIIGELIETTPLQKRLFSDYGGAVKSLGAWGGDFVLACGDRTTPAYFSHKGYPICLAYKDLISYGF